MSRLYTYTDDELIGCIYRAEAKAKALTEAAKEMREALRDRVKEGEQFETEDGSYRVVVSGNRRFNAKKALTLVEQVVPAHEQYLVLTNAVDKAKFQALYPDLYTEAQDEGSVRITITETEEALGL